MQIVLKSNEKFSSIGIKTLATKVTRLEIAGSQVASADDRSLVGEITEETSRKAAWSQQPRPTHASRRRGQHYHQ